MPVDRESEGKVLLSLGLQTWGGCLPPTLWFGDRNLPQQEPQDTAVYPHQETMREGEQLIQVFGDNISREGIFVGWKMYGCPFKSVLLNGMYSVKYCGVLQEQLMHSSRVDQSKQCKGRNQT